jgi:transcriptional regulator with XRE-family HTH domain
MSLGKTLREAREGKGLSLEVVEEETKIRKKYLSALENEDYEALPGRVYARAFLRTYSRFLGLEADPLLAEFEKANPQEPRETLSENRPITPVGAGKRSGYRGFLLVAGVVVLLLVFNALYDAVRSGGYPAPTVPPEAAVEDNGAPSALTDPEPEPVEEPTSPEGLDLVLRVTQSACWMRVVVDGEEAFQGTLRAGEVVSFQGRESISLRLGNPGVVEVELNGESLGPLAPGGRPIDHEFRVEG